MIKSWRSQAKKCFRNLRLVTALPILGLFAVGLTGLAPAPAHATAGINQTVNYQGRLLNAAGAVVADGTYNMQFKIYQDGPGNVAGDTGGTLMWTESWVYGVNTPDNRVTVKNGYFSVPLGSICSFSSTTCTANTGNAQTNTFVDFNQDTLWLSMNVGNTTTAATFAGASSDGEMLPMRRLAANVYALNSGKLGGLTSSQFVQLGQGIQAATSTTNAAIGINQTGATASILDLQRGGADVQLINNSGQTLFRPTVDSQTALQVQKAGTTTVAFTVDTTNSRIGIGTGAPAYAVDAVGSINASVSLKVAGTDVCTSSGCTPASGSTSYIQNQNTGAQASSNFNISGNGTAANFYITPAGSIDTTSAGILNIGTATATTINVGTTNTIAQTIGVGSSNASTTLNLQGNTIKETLNGTSAIFTGTTSGYDTATIGPELFTAANSFFAATGWTGLAGTAQAATATHTAGGGVTAIQTTGSMSLTIGSYYLITYSTSGSPTIPETVRQGFVANANGGQYIMGNDNGEGEVIKAATSSIMFTPTNNWNGTISGLSIKLITFSSPVLQVASSSGSTALEIHTGGVSTNNNSFVGVSAGQTNTTGTSGTAVGSGALLSNTTGNFNTAFGAQALQSEVNGSSNTAVGYQAALSITGATSNTALGYQAMYQNTTGNNNVAVGSNALGATRTGSANTAIGLSSLINNVTGIDNTSLGVYAGNNDADNFYSPTNLQYATAVGAFSQVQANNSLILGAVASAYATQVGIGTTQALNTLSVEAVDYNTGTASQAATTVTGAGGATWTPAMVGDQLTFGMTSSSAQYTPEIITGWTDATHVTVSVSQTIASTKYRFHKPGLQVTNSGQVGIGTTAPTQTLTVAGTTNLVTSSSVALQVQNSSSTSIVAVNTAAGANLIENPSFETGSLPGWSPRVGAVLTIDTTAPKFGLYHLTDTSAPSAGAGYQYNVQLAPSTTYSLSLYARLNSGSSSVFNIGRADNGSDTDCLTGQTLTTTYTQFTCTFTTGASVGPNSNIYLVQSDTLSRTVYLDGVTLVTGTTAQAFASSQPANALQIDAAANQITLNGSNSNDLQPWKRAVNSLPGIRSRAATVTANGYIYLYGGGTGVDGGTPQNNVYYAKANADGSLGSWTTNANSLGTAVQGNTGAVVNGYIYSFGGSTTNLPAQGTTLVQYARLNKDGSTGTWSTTTAMPAARSNSGATTYNGYVYVAGGADTSNTDQNNLYYAQVNGDGTISSWTTNATNLSYFVQGVQPVVANGSLFLLGGGSGAGQTVVDIFKLNTNGSATGLIASNVGGGTAALTGLKGDLASFVLNGVIYAVGGYTGGTIDPSIYYSKIENDTTTGAYQTSSNPVGYGVENARAIVINGYVYLVGGDNNSVAVSSIYYTSSARTQIHGSLDLVGGTGLGLTEGGSGGTLTAGNTTIVGTLGVQDATTFNSLVAINGSLAVNAPATFRNITDSTTALNVETAAGSSLLVADTLNQRVALQSGSSAGSLGGATIDTAGAVNDFPTGWTATNWATGANSATHTSGNVSALTSTWTPTIGTSYQVSYSYTGCASPLTLKVTLGGQTLQNTTDCVGTNTRVITATTTAGLSFLPSTNYVGVVSSVVVKTITQIASVLNLKNSGGSTTLEVRSSGSTTNAFVGLSVGQDNTSGTQNTGVGSLAVSSNTTGGQNTGIGSSTLLNNTTGSFNTGVGAFALLQNSTASSNSAVGYGALQNVQTGGSNSALGYSSLAGLTTGTNNTALGYSALGNIITGSNNSALGYSAGNYDSGGQFFTATALQNTTSVGAYATAQASNSIVLGSVDTPTNVGIGTTIPANLLSVSPLDLTGTASATTGGVVTSTVGTFTSAMVGETVIFTNGVSGVITTYTSGTQVSITPSPAAAVSSQAFRTHRPGFQVTSAGNAFVQNTSTTALQALNTAGTAVFGVDTQSNIVTVGGQITQNAGSNATALVVNGTSTAVLTVDTSANRVTIGSVGGCTGGNGKFCVAQTASSGGNVTNSSNVLTLNGSSAGTNYGQRILVSDLNTAVADFNYALFIDQSATSNASASSNGIYVKAPAAGGGGNLIQLQGGANNVLTATNAGLVTLGTASGLTGQLAFTNSANAFTSTVTGNTSASASYTSVLPAAVGAAGQCLTVASVVTTTQTLGYGACSGGGGVTLQGSTPGVADTGNYNISGTGIIGTQLKVGSIGTAVGQSYVAGKLPAATAGSVANAGAKDVAVAGRYAYVVITGAVEVVDISNPAAPANISSVTVGTPSNITVAGHFAYVTSTFGGIYVIDISNPKVPVLTTTIGASTATQYPVVSGRYLYAASTTGSGYFEAYDISNPASPVLLSSTVPSGGTATYSLAAQGKYLYVGAAAASGSLLDVYDVSSPAAPVFKGSLTNTGISPYVAVVGRYVYMSTSSAGTLTIYDVSNPSTPAVAGSLAIGTTPLFVRLAGRYAYLLNTADNTMQIVDVSNPTSPASIGTVATGSLPQGLQVDGRYAYVANNTTGTFTSYDLGGTYSQALEAGSTELGSLNVNSNATLGGDVSLVGSLTVGQTLAVNATAAIAGGLQVGSAATDAVQSNLQLDSYNAFTDSGTCSTTVSQGALYYNSVSAAIRGCVNGSWEDVVTTSGLGILTFGVIPDSANAGAPGDVGGISNYSNSPCKVVWGSATSVTVEPCLAYSGGRKVVVPVTTINLTAGNLPISAYANICLTGAGGQPALGASNATETSAAVPAFSANNPVICLATIRANGTAGNIGNIWDTRVFTNTIKAFASVNSVASNGYLVIGTVTPNTVQTVAVANSGPLRGVIVATTGTASSSAVNAIIATRGLMPTKFVAGSLASINTYVATTTTAGYAVSVAIGGAISNYAIGGLLLTSISTSCLSTNTITTACQYSAFVDFEPSR